MPKDIKENVIFVFSSCLKKVALFPRYIAKEGYEVYSLFEFDNFVTVGFNQIAKKKLGVKIRRKYNHKLVNKECTIIVFDAMVDLIDLKWLKKNNPKARCVFVIWNPIEYVKIDLSKVRKIGFDIWSYDKEQCDKYKVKQNLSFFCKSMYPLDEMEQIEIKNDICYVGKDKGRFDKIKKLIRNNKWEKQKWNLYITADHFWQRFKNKNYKKNISYLEVQKIQAASKAILEIVPSQSVNITMRAIDAMVLNRKLVTDSRNAVNMDYYNKNNVFVIDVDDSGTMEEFLNLPYVPVDKKIVEKYEIKNWIDRIIDDKPVNY